MDEILLQQLLLVLAQLLQDTKGNVMDIFVSLCLSSVAIHHNVHHSLTVSLHI